MTEDYKMVKFGDVAKKVNETVNLETTTLDKYIGGEHMNTDDFRITDWGVLGDDYLGPAFNMMFKAGQILYGSRRTYLKKVSIPHFDGICANTTFVIKPTGKGLLPELVPFVMHSQAFTDHSIRESKGSTNPYINWKDIAKYEFPVPANIEKQKEIVETLGAAEDALAKNEAFLERAARMKRVLVRELFSKGIGHKEFKEKKGEEIPKSWEIVQLKDILSEKLINGYSGNGGNKTSNDEEVPTLTLSSVTQNDISEKYTKIIVADPEMVKDFWIQKDDIFVERSNTREFVGLASLNQNEIPFAIFTDLLIRIRVNKDVILPKYLVEYLLLPKTRIYFQRQAKGTAGSMLKIDQKILENLLIPLPSLPEQHQITTTLIKTDAILAAAHESVSLAKNMKFRLIDEYFPSKEKVLT